MMNNPNDRRRWPRKTLELPDVCLLNIEEIRNGFKAALKEADGIVYVDICDVSQGGVLIKSEKKIESNALLQLQIYDSSKKQWNFSWGNVRWIKNDASNPGYFQVGVEIQPEDSKIKPEKHVEETCKQKPLPEDFEFFRNTKLLRFIPRNAVCPLLNSVTYKRLKAGERLMSQGEVGEICYIIQHGLCVANVKRNDGLHTVARLKDGDIVGEMAIVTGEPRNAIVDAETDMELWCLTRSHFDNISKEYPELRTFMTELVANRFESSKVTAHRTINKYIITDIIGRGGYSIVYKGVHADLNMPVAIKMMKHDLAMNPNFIKGYWNEAKIIARFNHNNIVRVYDIEDLYRTVFIIMELLEGENLDEMLARLKNVSVPQAIDYLLQICSGLDYAHQRGLVHQDIKPGNIFVQRDGQVKILDFGLACPAGTADKVLAGTTFYMAPEQIKGEVVDQRTDIYALGLTAFEMVTGQRPFIDDDSMDEMRAQIGQEIIDPTTILPNLPEALQRFLRKACHRDPDQRYQDVKEAMEGLQPLANEFGLSRKILSQKKAKMTTLFLIYKEDHQPVLNQIMEEFSAGIQRPGVVQKRAEFQLEEQKMTTLFLIYKEDHQLALNQIMEEFSDKVKKIGITQKAADFYVIEI